MLTSDVLPVQTDTEDLENRDNVSFCSVTGKVGGEEMFLDTAAMAIYAMAKSGELSSAPENLALATDKPFAYAQQTSWQSFTGTRKQDFWKTRWTLKSVCICSGICSYEMKMGSNRAL